MGLKETLNHMAYANIIISLGSVGTMLLTTSLLSLAAGPAMYFIMFAVTFFVYSANRLTDMKEDAINNPERTAIVRRRARLFLAMSLVLLALGLGLALRHSVATLLAALLPVVFVLVYSMRWLPQSLSSHGRLKEVFLVKNVVVSAGWAVLPFYVGIYTGSLAPAIVFLSAFVFLRIFIGVTVFDIRDIHGDSIHNIETLPVRAGIGRSKRVITGLNVLSLLILFTGVLLDSVPPRATVVGAFALMMGILYVRLLSSGCDLKFLCNVIVDGEYVLLGVVALLVSSVA